MGTESESETVSGLFCKDFNHILIGLKDWSSLLKSFLSVATKQICVFN